MTRHDAGGAKTAELRAMLTRVVTACDERDTCQFCRCSYGLEQLRTHCEEHVTPDGLDEENRNACEDWAAMLSAARALLAVEVP